MPDYRIRGIDQLRANLLSFPEKIASEALYTALTRGAAPIRAAAEANAPRRTGKLAGTIRTYKDKKPRALGLDARVLVWVLFKGKDAALNSKGRAYWKDQEFGTSKMPAHPFMRPAFESQKETALTQIIQSLADAVPRIANRLK